MFEILNGRGSFWQWDLNQKLVVQDLQNGAEVHFSNGNSDYALVTLVKTVDGKKVCDVPNVVLQKAGYVNVFAYVIDGEEKYTEYKAAILVLARSKPEDYIYTETETLCYKNLSEKIGDVSRLETDAKENLVDAVNEIAKKAASGADLSLGITGAEAGQIATVEAVDDQGKPTKWKHENIAGAVGFPAPTVSDNGTYLGCENGAAKWKPVDLPSGSAEEFELLTKNVETGEAEPIVMDAETLRYNFPSLADYKKLFIIIKKKYKDITGLTGYVWFRYNSQTGFTFNPSLANSYAEIDASLPGLCALKYLTSNNLQILNTPYNGTYTNVNSFESPHWIMPNTGWAEYYANCNTTITILGVRR